MSLLDKLPKNFPFFKKSQEHEYYFALNIDSERLTAAVWGLEGKRLHIISKSSLKYSSEDELIESANLVLDEALADFPNEPSKILFGVPSSWLQDDSLKGEYLKILKQMVQELDLQPMAYVSTVASISHYLQKQQGVPTTAILVDVSQPLVVSVVKAGKIIGSKEQKRSANLPEDIEKALLSFTDVEVLPSKILVYGEDDLNKFKEELTSFSWMAQLPFLHLPKIDQLDKDTTIISLCLAGATELNSDAIYHSTADIPDFSGSVSKIAQAALRRGESQSSLKDLGFISGNIEQEKPNKRVEEETYLDRQGEELDSRELIHPEAHLPDQRHHPLDHHLSETNLSLTRFLKIPPVLKHRFSRLFAFLPKKTLLIPVVVLLLLILAALLLPRAKVTIFIDMRVLEKDSEITADPAIDKVDEENKRIPGQIVESNVSGSDKGQATGKKQIGDPAKGKVVIYNATDKSLSLDKGTTLVSDSGNKFSLDANVTVASKSASAADPPSHSSAVDAVAAQIGPDGNIPAGSDLKVASYSKSDVVAKVDSAFSGGISKDVTIVTADDQKRLLAKLSSQLRSKAKDELQTKLTGDSKILEESLSEQIIKSSYSKDVNDQSSEFSLNLSARYKGTAYKESDLKAIVSKLVETNVPQGYKLDLSQTETQAEVSKVEKDGKLIFKAKFKAKLMPKLDENKIKNDIKGKTPQQAAEKMKKIENVIGSNIKITPSLPLKQLQILPLLPQNISIEVTAK